MVQCTGAAKHGCFVEKVPRAMHTFHAIETQVDLRSARTMPLRRKKIQSAGEGMERSTDQVDFLEPGDYPTSKTMR